MLFLRGVGMCVCVCVCVCGGGRAEGVWVGIAGVRALSDFFCAHVETPVLLD